MPKEAYERGGAEKFLPLLKIAPTIMTMFEDKT